MVTPNVTKLDKVNDQDGFTSLSLVNYAKTIERVTELSSPRAASSMGRQLSVKSSLNRKQTPRSSTNSAATLQTNTSTSKNSSSKFLSWEHFAEEAK